MAAWTSNRLRHKRTRIAFVSPVSKLCLLQQCHRLLRYLVHRFESPIKSWIGSEGEMLVHPVWLAPHRNELFFATRGEIGEVELPASGLRKPFAAVFPLLFNFVLSAINIPFLVPLYALYGSIQRS